MLISIVHATRTILVPQEVGEQASDRAVCSCPFVEIASSSRNTCSPGHESAPSPIAQLSELKARRRQIFAGCPQVA